MSSLERSSATISWRWWRRNRSWALPTGVLAVLLPLVAVGSCAGTILTLGFGTVRLGASLRKHDRRLLDE
jgi:hypothetical protein